MKPSTRRTMYLALVLLHLGYATQVWSPQSIKLMKSLERVQRRAPNVHLNVTTSKPNGHTRIDLSSATYYQ